MPVELSLLPALDAPLHPRGPAAAWCAGGGEVAPRFAEPFAMDPGGLWFDGAEVPCFGVWNGIGAARRARMVAQLRLTRLREANDCALELLSEDVERRIVAARMARARTLGDASLRIAEVLRRGRGLPWSWLGRGPRREGLGEKDCVRVPVIRAFGQSGDVRLSIELGTDGRDEPVPAEITEGRADVYERRVLFEEPFFFWVGDRRTLAPSVVAWIVRP